MPRSRKEKRQHNDSAPEQRARVIKSGMYDGSNSSRDFVVSGHSTGSANTEMEALSHQVSIDAGRVPDYQVDDYVSDTRKRGFGSTADVNGDVDTPELYNDESSYSGSDFGVSAQQTPKSSIFARVLRGSLIGAGVGAASYVAYIAYEQFRSRKAAEPIFYFGK